MKTSRQLLARHVLDAIITPALNAVGFGGRAACELILGTGIQESRLIYRKQNGGPALGLFQMEPATFNDIWNGYVVKHPQVLRAMRTLLDGNNPTPAMLAKNDLFAAAMCRLLYRRLPFTLPDAGDIDAQAACWKHYYNTPLGAGKVSEYLDNWRTYVDQDTFGV